MNTSHRLSLVLSVLLLSAAGLTQAQTTVTPHFSQAAMDREPFLSMHYWDAMTGLWVVREDFPLPKGVKSRSEVMAMTEDFLKMNRWDDSTSQWVPMTAARDMSKLTREEVRVETIRFLMTHRFDESTSTWISKMKVPG